MDTHNHTCMYYIYTVYIYICMNMYVHNIDTCIYSSIYNWYAMSYLTELLAGYRAKTIHSRGVSRRPHGRPPSLGALESQRLDQEMSRSSWCLAISEQAFRELAGSRYLERSTWCQVVGTKYAGGTKYLVSRAWYPRPWYRVLVPSNWYKAFVPTRVHKPASGY